MGVILELWWWSAGDSRESERHMRGREEEHRVGDVDVVEGNIVVTEGKIGWRV